MTQGSIREYTEAVRGRYLQASKKEKSRTLDQSTKVIGCHRNAAIRLLRRGNQFRGNKKRRRAQQYGAAVDGALRVAWEATNRSCSKRLPPFLPELVKVLRRHGDTTMTTGRRIALALPDEPVYHRPAVAPWRRLGGAYSR